MSGAASFGGGFAPGSGRSIDMVWPGRLGVMPSGGLAAAGLGFWGRQSGGVPLNNAAASQNAGAGCGVNWSHNWHGRACAQFFSGVAVAGNGFRYYLATMTMEPALGQPVDEGDPADDLAFWRCVGIMSFPGQAAFSPTALVDIGIEWIVGTPGVGGMVSNNISGFGFLQTAVHEISFYRNNGGAVASTVVRSTSPADLEAWHSYEVRIAPATRLSVAKLTALIDRRPVLSLDWAIGTSLPYPSNGANYGFQTALMSTGGGGLFVNRVRFMAAESMEALTT